MKNKYFSYVSASLLMLSLVLLTNTVNAKVWRVNNRAGVDADFSSIMQAHDSGLVQAGDNLYVEASSGSHGTVTLTKRLVLIGPGIFLAENPETQADNNSAMIGLLTFDSGSDGSVVKGFRINNVRFYASNIVFQGNYVVTNNSSYSYAILLGSDISNIIIRNNYMLQQFTTNPSEVVRATVTGANNIIITNNYIEVTSTFSSRFALRLLDGFSGIIENNVLHGQLSLYNAEFHNNILRTGSVSSTNTNITHNIANGTQFGNLDGNQQNVNMADVFVGPTGNSTDGQWQLAVGSPAIGAGVDGTDIGMFGGATPYKLSGIPNIPAIYEINHTIKYLDQEIEIDFSVKSHN